MTFHLIHGQYSFRACDCARAHAHTMREGEENERKFSSLFISIIAVKLSIFMQRFIQLAALFKFINSIVLQWLVALLIKFCLYTLCCWCMREMQKFISIKMLTMKPITTDMPAHLPVVRFYHRTRANASEAYGTTFIRFSFSFPFDTRAHTHSEFTYKQAAESNRKIG